MRNSINIHHASERRRGWRRTRYSKPATASSARTRSLDFRSEGKKLSHGSQAINNIPFPMLFARRIPLVFFVFLSRDFIFNCTQSKQKRTGESQRRDGTGKKRQNKSQTIYSNLLSFPSGDLHEKIRQKLYANFGWICAE